MGESVNRKEVQNALLAKREEVLATRKEAELEAWLKQYAFADADDAKQKAILNDISAILDNYKVAEGNSREFHESFYRFLSRRAVDPTRAKQLEVMANLVQPDEVKRKAFHGQAIAQPGAEGEFAKRATKMWQDKLLPIEEVDLKKERDKIVDKLKKATAEGERSGADAVKAAPDAAKRLFDKAGQLVDSAKGALTAKTEDPLFASYSIGGADKPADEQAADGKKTEEEKNFQWGKILGGLAGLVAAFLASTFLGGLTGDGIMGSMLKIALLIGGTLIGATKFDGFFDSFFSNGTTKPPSGDTKQPPGKGKAQGKGEVQQHFTEATLNDMLTRAQKADVNKDFVVFKPKADGASYDISMEKNPDSVPGGIKLAVAEITRSMQACTAHAVDIVNVNGSVTLQCVPGAAPASASR